MDELVKLNIKHQLLVKNLGKSGDEILKSLTPQAIDLLHMAVGVAGEAGELLDAVKKHVIYNKPVDKENIIEELGDLEFYMQGIRANLFILRSEVLEFNIQKLTKRYSSGSYSDKEAHDRVDKK